MSRRKAFLTLTVPSGAVFIWGLVLVESCLANVSHGATAPPRLAQELPPPLIREQQRSLPLTPTTAPARSAQRYLVYINGSSLLLLDAIRRTVPAASLQRYKEQTIIQAGVFEDLETAGKQIEALELQGFIVQLDTISVGDLSPVNAVVSSPSLAPPSDRLPSFPQSNPAAPLANRSSSLGYVVYVDDDSPLNLTRVREIVPDAFMSRVGGAIAIQVGNFADEANATEQVRYLATRGIRARIAQIPVTAASYENRALLETVNSRSYYAIVPGNRSNLPALAARVGQLVEGRAEILQKSSPRGAHLAIGPFSDRQEAERWNSYLRGAGINNSRVYFGR